MATKIEERLAWIHALASDLNTSDAVELKATLRQLAVEAAEVAELVSEDIKRRRRRPQTARHYSNANTVPSGKEFTA